MVIVFGKEGCSICEAAKQKLEKMEKKYEVKELAEGMALHDEWRTDGSVEVTAFARLIETDHIPLPIIQIDGRSFRYSEAMKFLKKEKKTRERLAV